jgi:hypothetical protein
MNNNHQTVIPSEVEGSIRISYPPSGGFRIFDSCALIFYMFLQNEPNLKTNKITISPYNVRACSVPLPAPAGKTNPFLPLLRHTTRTPFLAQNGRFYKNLRQKAHLYPFQPRKFEPIFTPPATHDAPLDSGSRSHISPKSPAKTPISTSSHAKIRTQFRRKTPPTQQKF